MSSEKSKDSESVSREEEKSSYWTIGTTYEEFLAEEDVPIHDGFSINVKNAEVDTWERTGGKGAIADLVGHEGLNNILIHEIPSGESLEPWEPLFEQIVYVVSGNGATTLTTSQNEEYTFEWGEDSLFFLPRNVEYEHKNLGTSPARLIADTDMPILFSLLRDTNHIFNSKIEFPSPSPENYDEGGSIVAQTPGNPVLWESSFIPSLTEFEELGDYQLRGGRNVKFRFPYARSLRAHMAEHNPLRYEKAHRHSGGTSILMLEGDEYELMWPPGEDGFDERVRFDAGPGDLFVPPTHWWHQHFNVGTEPARYIALYAPVRALPRNTPVDIFDPKNPDNRIPFHKESPKIRELFEEALADRGLKSEMPEDAYTDPDHELNRSYEEVQEEYYGEDEEK